jgi:Tol biopolymer transport system component
MKLTSFNGPLTGSPSWSPDDRQIAFDSRTEGWSHIFVMNADGGAPRKLTTGTFNNIIPNWSNDGRWVYFASRRTGSWQIWKVSVSTGQIVQVTRSGGFVGKESPDGRWLYYTKYSQSGLWRMPLQGGAEVKILNDPPPEYWAYFSITREGIYVLNVHGAESGIDFYRFATSSSSRVYKLAQPPVRYSSLTVSADGRWILFTNAVTRYHDLVLAENFH